jgi:hypothetical protein
MLNNRFHRLQFQAGIDIPCLVACADPCLNTFVAASKESARVYGQLNSLGLEMKYAKRYQNQEYWQLVQLSDPPKSCLSSEHPHVESPVARMGTTTNLARGVAHNVQATRRCEPPVSNCRPVARAVSNGVSTLLLAISSVRAPVCRCWAPHSPLHLPLSLTLSRKLEMATKNGSDALLPASFFWMPAVAQD